MERITYGEAYTFYGKINDLENKYVIEIQKRLNEIEDILGDDYDLERLRELVQSDRDGRCVVVTMCSNCKNHVEFEGEHYCKFWRMYCPNDSEFYCKAAKDALEGERNELG